MFLDEFERRVAPIGAGRGADHPQAIESGCGIADKAIRGPENAIERCEDGDFVGR
jgi:hypothetical protein